MANTLEVYHNGVLVFSSKGRWLHPLFELERFLASGDLRPEELEIRDKVVGRAAAAMMVRLRLGRVAGLTYGVDLIGSCAGAFLVSAFLVPIIGIPNTCFAVVLLSVIALALLAQSYFRGSQPG